MYGYSIPQPPPPPPVAQAPAPYMGDMIYEIAVEPNTESPLVTYGGRGREEREKQYYDSKLGIGRSNSGRDGRRGASVHVSDSRRRSRSRPRSYYPSDGRYNDYDRVYYGSGGGGGAHYYPESAYSSSSRGSHRDHSRPRPPGYPSNHSEYEFPPYPGAFPWQHGPPPAPPVIMAPAGGPGPAMPPAGTTMVPWQPHNASPDLNARIAKLQLELQESKKESERIKKAKEEEEARKKKEAELAKAVQERIEKEKRAAEEAKKKADAEAARIKAAAVKLIEDEKKAAEEAKKKKAAEEAKIKEAAIKYAEEQKKKQEDEAKKKKAEAEAAAALFAAQQTALDLRKPTHTKFSKTHLCKEALDERKLSYTEAEDHFLVHRWVDRDEQNLLWARTKQIRAYQLEYQKRFKEEADKAPVIDTPNGPVKIVRVGNNPPVTVPVVIVTKKAPVSEEVGKFRIFGR